MKLKEVLVGSNVEIIFISDDKKLVFESVVTKVVDDTLLIEPIMEEDMTVGFKNHEVTIICITDNKPYIWTKVKVKLVKYNEQIYHQLITDTDGAHVNRRNSYRMYVGTQGMVNNLNKSYEVIIKDVSAKGCAFITTEKFEIGDNVVVSFTDENENFVIRCAIVRTEEVESSGRYIYGCEMKLNNRKIEKYVNDKQLKEIKRRSASVLDKKNK